MLAPHHFSSDTNKHSSAALLQAHNGQLLMLMVADGMHPGKDMSRQRQPPISEHEAAVMSRAQKLDSDLDHMLAGLLKAFERAPEAVGNKLVLQQISSSVRLTEHIDGGGGGDYDGKPAFTVTRQVRSH